MKALAMSTTHHRQQLSSIAKVYSISLLLTICIITTAIIKPTNSFIIIRKNPSTIVPPSLLLLPNERYLEFTNKKGDSNKKRISTCITLHSSINNNSYSNGIKIYEPSINNNEPNQQHLQQQQQQQQHDLETFIQCLSSMSLPIPTQNSILDIIQSTMEFTSSTELYALSIDFVDRPEVLSHILRQDFGISVGKSHLIRGALMKLVDVMNSNSNSNNNDVDDVDDKGDKVSNGASDDRTSIDCSDKENVPSTSTDIDENRINILCQEDQSTTPTTASTTATATATATATVTTTNIDDPHDSTKHEQKKKKQPLFKSVIVNTKAKKRMSTTYKNDDSNNNKINTNYGLPSNYKTIYPKLSTEIDNFLIFMTKPSTVSSQESPIRKATATVYIRHAKLFLGWWTKQNQFHTHHNDDYHDTKSTFTTTSSTSSSTNSSTSSSTNSSSSTTIYDNISIYNIFPNNESKSAQPIIDFILWLRETRDISNSYEANMLRGLTKLLKFRFCEESIADPSYGEKSFSDIQAVREIRKLHRDANRRQVLSPRSSEEDKKWLDWDEYLGVIKAVKDDLEKEIQLWQGKEQMELEEKRNKKTKQKSSTSNNCSTRQKANKAKVNSTSTNSQKSSASSISTPAQRRIATKYQAYLILAFFSCVPDRQRTFRELQLEKTFIKDENINCWIIKHGPDDYKTGSTYGDRPPLVLVEELTPSIDDFLQRWRPCLAPNSHHFFVQPRTGNAFTQDSVYSLVARSCYKFTGKKTNPHLLRDMIVTHVRDSNASEKELEALALYMGHSINMQRTSYDRRTMKQKIAPAVQLLQNINNKATVS